MEESHVDPDRPGWASAHLIANKGRHQRAACSDSVASLLVETVGEVTCSACREIVISMYGEPARRLYASKDGTPGGQAQ